MKAHKPRIDRLEMMIDDYGKKLSSLKDRVVDVEKASGGSEGSSKVKARQL